MEYLKKSFTVACGGDALYRANHNRIFAQSIQSMVHEFHEVYGQPVAETPSIPALDRVRFRLDLIAEELCELLEASGCTGVPAVAQVLTSVIGTVGEVDIVEVADALADIAYVVEGTNLEFGINSAAVLAEVHRSNLSKLGADGKPIYNASGKVVKGPYYTTPNIPKVLCGPT